MELSKPKIFALLLIALGASQLSRAADTSTSDTSTPGSALQISNEQQLRITQYRDLIARLETEFGGFDQRLLESLRGLTTVLVEAGEFDEAERLLERRLQLQRTLTGPASLDQLPALLKP